MREGRVRQSDNTEEVGLHLGTHRIDGLQFDRADVSGTGVIDHGVQPAVTGEDPVDAADNCCRVDHIERADVDTDPGDIGGGAQGIRLLRIAQGRDDAMLRIPLAGEPDTGLSKTSSIMVDKVTTMPRAKLAEHIGTVSDTTMLVMSRAPIVFLGIA